MEKFNTVSQLFKAICDNLRIKKDITGLINHSDIPDLIDSINTYNKILILPKNFFSNDIIISDDLNNLKDYIDNEPSSLIVLDYLFSNKLLDTDFYNIDLNLENEKYKVLSLNDMFSNSSFNNSSLETLEPLINSENALYSMRMFENSNFKNIDFITLPLNSLMYSNNMFENSKIEGELKNLRIDKGNLINCESMFKNSTISSLDLSDINIDNCINTKEMFNNSLINELKIGENFKITEKCEDCSSMFKDFDGTIEGNFDNFKFNENISLNSFFSKTQNVSSQTHRYDLSIFRNMDVSKVKDFSNIFFCRLFNLHDDDLDFLNWDMTNCEKLDYAFSFAVGGFYGVKHNPFQKCILSNIKSMKRIFYYNRNLDTFIFENDFTYNNPVDISYCCYTCNFMTKVKLNHIKVSDMSYAFYICRLTDIDISNWDLSECTNFNNAFYNAFVQLQKFELPSFKIKDNATFSSFMWGSNVIEYDLSKMDFSEFSTTKTNSETFSNMCSSLTYPGKKTVILPDFYFTYLPDMTWCYSSNSSYQVDVKMGGPLKTFGCVREGDNPNVSRTITLNLVRTWNTNNQNNIESYETFVESLGQAQDNRWTKTVKIHTNLYNVLTTEQKEMITNKGYTLSYGTS